MIRQSGTDRTAIRDGLATVKDAPSVVYGTVRFNPQTRRVDKPLSTRLVVKGGAFALWDGARDGAAKAAN